MPANTISVYEKISDEYYSLTASERKLADFLLSNQEEENPYLPIAQLAESCQVSQATVSRFCRRLGYGEYNLFRLALADAASRHRPWSGRDSGQEKDADSLEGLGRKILSDEVETLTQTLELLNRDTVQKAVSLLEQGRRVLCMGEGGSVTIALEAAHLFSTVCSRFLAVPNPHMQVMTLASGDPGDVVLYFSYSGSAKAGVNTLKLAKKQGLSTILITRFPSSPAAAYGDVVLQCGASQNPLQSDSVPARMAQLYLLEVLFTEMTRRNTGAYEKTKSRVADALAAERI